MWKLDLVAHSRAHTVVVLTGSYETFDAEQLTALPDLFRAGSAFRDDAKRKVSLLFYARKFVDGVNVEKVITIDFTRYPSFELWHSKKCPSSAKLPF